MLCKYQLNINGQLYNLSDDCIKNWDEVSYAIKRSDYGGVLRSFSSSFQFVGQAYDLLYAEYLGSYLDAKANISIYTIDDKYKYKLLYSARLDFGSLEISDGVLKINSFDDTLASILNSKKSTQFEYDVATIKETSPLRYDHLELLSETHWIDGGTLDDTIEGQSYVEISKNNDRDNCAIFPLAIKTSEIAVKNQAVPYDLLDFGMFKRPDLPFFFETMNSIEVQIDIDFTVTLGSPVKQGEIVKLVLGVRNEDYDVGYPIITELHHVYIHHSYTDKFSVHRSQYIRKGSQLVFYLEYKTDKNRIIISDFKDFCFKFKASGAMEYCDVIRPVTLLNSLLSSMCPGQNVSGEIVASDKRVTDAMIVAAESLRDLPQAKIYTSYKKFCDWMKAVFGFVPVISDNKVTFVHRDTLYVDEPAIECNEVKDVSVKVNDGLIYSSVKVGIKRKEYDSINGREEFHWETEYETGTDIKSNTLQLISPYRADAYGAEFLVNKRGEESSGTESDADVFFVNAFYDTDWKAYVLNRNGQVSGLFSSVSMFNKMYSPRSFVEANKRFIASFSNMLKYASSTGNSDITIEQVKETDDFILQDRLFTVAELTFTSLSNIEAKENRLVTVHAGGREYTGYMAEKKVKYGRYEGIKYKLLIKTIK